VTEPLRPVGVQPVRPAQKVERRDPDERVDPNRHKRTRVRERKPERPPLGDDSPHVDVLA
jgi:hypothetical protein